MASIKQYEMYTNLWSVVPDEYKYFYLKPTEDIINTNKNRWQERETKIKRGDKESETDIQDESKVEGGNGKKPRYSNAVVAINNDHVDA